MSTFTEIVSDVTDRLNLTSTEAITRVGRAVNRRYKTLTSSLGLSTSRRGTVQATAGLGVNTLVFTSVEKLYNVVDRSVSPYRVLEEFTVDELEAKDPTGLSTPTQYAILSMGSSTVTILMNCVPQTTFTLYADAVEIVSTLSGSQEPAFPQSYHDILMWGALADEYRKLEKDRLADDAEREYMQRLSDLRMFISISTSREVYQGKIPKNLFGTSGGSGSSSSVNGASSYTQTGLITFDRDPLAPFVVTSGSAKVANLDADLLDGLDSTYFLSASNLATGTLPNGRFPATLPAASGVNLTALNATQLTSGTVPDARFPATLPAASGVNLTNLNATNLASGTVANARLNVIIPPTVITLVDGATPALDASLGNVFKLTALGNRTIGIPTNPVAGQKIIIEHYASGGARTLSLNTGAGGFRFGTDVAALTATSSGKWDYIGAIYNGTDSKWDVVAYSKGY